jgi:DHA1 family multidrug resistance protein-like MFS transporter
LGTFAWSFVYVSLPFYIQRLGPADPIAGLRWTGWILGITPLVTVVMAPVWGRLAGRGNPKAFYVVVQSFQGLVFFGMALARSLPELFAVRLALGVVGASSTFAFIMAGRAGHDDAVRRQVASVQGMMTVGQVLGPLAGAIAAARMGFRASFVLGAVILLASAAVVQRGAVATTAVAPGARHTDAPGWRVVVAVCVLALGSSVHVIFLASVLPQVLPVLGVAGDSTLVVGGVLIFASGVAAALGSLAAPRLEPAMRDHTALVWLLAASSALIAALGLLGSAWTFGVVRFLQVLCVAPVVPIAFAAIAPRAGGQVMGIVNSARIAAGFVGPVVATTVLAWWPAPAVLYAVLALMGLACVPFATGRRAAGVEARP